MKVLAPFLKVPVAEEATEARSSGHGGSNFDIRDAKYYGGGGFSSHGGYGYREGFRGGT